MPSPAYPPVEPSALTAITARLLHQKRSFRLDSQRLCARVAPAIVYSGLENLPAHGPLLLTTNHYARPGFNTAWMALGISAALPVEVAWIMANEWMFEGSPFAFLLRPAMRFVLKSFTLTYQFLPMPTMVPGIATPQQRSAGVRCVIERLRAHPDTVLGLAPEGMDSPEGGLGMPPSGVGRFVHYLDGLGLPILPIGVSELDGALHVRFGQSYSLPAVAYSSHAEEDLAIREIVMEHIRRLLPEPANSTNWVKNI